MKIIAEPSKRDFDMIKLYGKNEKFMLGAIHIDHFLDDKKIYDRLNNGERLTLSMDLLDEG